VKLQHFSRGQRDAYWFIYIRTPEWARAVSVTTEIVGISMAFGFTGIAEDDRISMRIDHTHRMPHRGADTCRITCEVVAEARALGITPVVKLDHGTAMIDTDRIIDIRAGDRAGTCRGVTVKIIRVSMAQRVTIIGKLNDLSVW
jgi:hypothetical protein